MRQPNQIKNSKKIINKQITSNFLKKEGFLKIICFH